ncbi:hypothetical protein RHSIM_Rhsim05G0159900 [Rhododendron simsii]|uniref:Protein FAR1-RELATED SEQUENCE n=1 Tax=Rhododendron simsii TaxID=118357 RepID=A0A834H676_RHOSS|nr:hypothetical protein RHSIM_Rhsim05G0159900 [Rhododendron simsii]
METPNSSTNNKGVKVDSYDWESNSDSCSSSEDSQSNTFVSEDEDNDVDGEGEGEGEGSVSCVNDSFRLLTDMEIVKMKFVSEDEAGQFYNAYAKAIGFSVRKYKSRRQIGNEMYVRWRAWVCSREGKRNKKHLERTNRKRRHRAETRTGCGVKFRVCCMSKTMKNYVVTEFVSTHNHPLAAPHCVPFLRSHRRVGDADIAQVMAMQNVGMKPAQIMDSMTYQSGGFHNVGFTVKDLRSGRSKMDYAAFGDVLVFDTTYRTNAYKKPFVILAGVSNNFTTTIFGCALLSKETEDTHNWVLSTFLEAMNGKRPISVVTDGDLAMCNAIRNIFPNARHRLCSWHLERNAAKNVHIPEFVSDFTILMQMECDIEEFETLWADMVSHYGLETNAWVVEMYSDRERWAEAYLLGHFFAGMRSTQRYEGMNRYLNRFLTVRLRLFEFVQQYHRGLARMRVADAKAETATEHSTPVLITQLKSLEKNGTEVYTQSLFRFFQDEIQRPSALIVARRFDEMERRLYFIEILLVYLVAI